MNDRHWIAATATVSLVRQHHCWLSRTGHGRRVTTLMRGRLFCLLGLGFLGIATLQAEPLALQGPESRVQWAAALVSPGTVKGGDATTLELSGTIEDGWHVYALTQ